VNFYTIHILYQYLEVNLTMQTLSTLFDRIDTRITNWMAKYGIVLLRMSLGIVFFWFGVLKFFPDLSPAQELATRTISTLTFGIVTPNISLPLLALWECVIGLGLITGKFMRITLLLLLVQMMGTVTPIFLFPGEVFTRIPYAPTLEGQYIIKNMVLISAGLVIGATVRGGRLIADPAVIERIQPEIKTRSEA
jgi:uncharacterized membrane protein YphA (DoxX/SURF4 family)